MSSFDSSIIWNVYFRPTRPNLAIISMIGRFSIEASHIRIIVWQAEIHRCANGKTLYLNHLRRNLQLTKSISKSVPGRFRRYLFKPYAVTHEQNEMRLPNSHVKQVLKPLFKFGSATIGIGTSSAFTFSSIRVEAT